MPLEQAELPAAAGIPEDHVAVLDAPTRDAAVGRERDRMARAVLQRIAGRARGGVPEPDDPVQRRPWRSVVPVRRERDRGKAPLMTANDAADCAAWRHPRASPRPATIACAHRRSRRRACGRRARTARRRSGSPSAGMPPADCRRDHVPEHARCRPRLPRRGAGESAEKATDRTTPLCPWNVASTRSVAASNRRTLPSGRPVA